MEQEINLEKCNYIFKKGIQKNQKCNRINCTLHNSVNGPIKSHTKQNNFTLNQNNNPTLNNNQTLNNKINNTQIKNQTQENISSIPPRHIPHNITVSVTIPQDGNAFKTNIPPPPSSYSSHNESTLQNTSPSTTPPSELHIGEDEKTVLKQKIMNSNTTLENKITMMKHYKNMIKSESDSSEYYKNKMFIETCVDIPWNKYYDTFQHIHTNREFIKTFIHNLKHELDKNIYGMENVKNEIINHICKFITNPHSTRNNLALYGSAGVCKTRFIKVLSKILNLPLQIISLGGVRDASYFLGHNYTYMESKCGVIVQNIIDANVMNPILYFDELDKVSQSEHGQDIYSVLSHLTDDTLNTNFIDHYLHGIKIDLSQVFYIFTFNDISKINKVLLDRLNIIYVDTPSKTDKIIILKKYCLPTIIENIGINIPIHFDTDCFKTIIDYVDKQIDVTVSSGIRESVRIFEKILLEINKEILLNTTALTFYHINYDQFQNYFNNMKKQFFFIQDSIHGEIPHSMYI